MKVAIIGESPGNGHPYSFGALLNGFREGALLKAGWPQIENYLRKYPTPSPLLWGHSVTHVWMPSKKSARSLACAINADAHLDKLKTLPALVDAALILRDDWKSHWKISQLFLTQGKAVFVDKPLTLAATEFLQFRPYFDGGKCMSTSALRYWRNKELLHSISLGHTVTFRIPHKWPQYGIHVLEFIEGIGISLDTYDLNINHQEVQLSPRNCSESTFIIELKSGFESIEILVDNRAAQRLFKLQFDNHAHVFTQLLREFFLMCDTGEPSLPTSQTQRILQVLGSANFSE